MDVDGPGKEWYEFNEYGVTEGELMRGIASSQRFCCFYFS
jgi:hypothetical protein